MRVGSQYIAPRLAGLGPKLAWKVRVQIYQEMAKSFPPQPEWRVLDVGVTSDQTSDSNFFERLYPYPASITAVGLEDASFLETEYPGLKFVLADACQLPFADCSFELVFCSAVIEHVGSRQKQEKLIRELTRVGKAAVITTPNRYFPIEFHTLTPFLHWMHPRIFRKFLRLTRRSFFADESHLNLLSDGDMEQLIRLSGVSQYEKRHQRLWGGISNLVYYVHGGSQD